MARLELSRKIKNFIDISLGFEPNSKTGDISLLKNERSINNSIKNIILTGVGEKPFDRNYGSVLSKFMFELIDFGTAGQIKL